MILHIIYVSRTVASRLSRTYPDYNRYGVSLTSDKTEVWEALSVCQAKASVRDSPPKGRRAGLSGVVERARSAPFLLGSRPGLRRGRLCAGTTHPPQRTNGNETCLVGAVNPSRSRFQFPLTPNSRMMPALPVPPSPRPWRPTATDTKPISPPTNPSLSSFLTPTPTPMRARYATAHKCPRSQCPIPSDSPTRNQPRPQPTPLFPRS